MDYFQDILNLLEDKEVTQEDTSTIDKEVLKDNTITELSIQYIMGWLTGQQQKVRDGENLEIKVSFNPDCLSQSPDHVVCYPRVSACSRQ